MPDNVGIPFEHLSAEQLMRLALDVARTSVGVSRPNPPVGAVIAKGGRVLATGSTRPVGGNHAEVEALLAAGELARDADMYVTLEPCSHHGRTPPCTDAILRAGIRRVFVGVEDPNPCVAGSGFRKLQEGGVEVVTGFLAAEAEEFHRGYLHAVRCKRPLIEVKIAQTVDGCIAGTGGQRTNISCEEAWKWVHQKRSIADAVVVGGGTLRIDNPLLTVRMVTGNQPIRIVLNGKSLLPADANLFAGGGSPTVVYSQSQQPQLGSVSVKPLPEGDFAHSWQTLIADLAAQGMHRILVEAGPALASHLLPLPWWDRLFILTSPTLLGDGLRWTTDLSNAWNESAQLSRFEPLGRDQLAVFENSRSAPL